MKNQNNGLIDFLNNLLIPDKNQNSKHLLAPLFSYTYEIYKNHKNFQEDNFNHIRNYFAHYYHKNISNNIEIIDIINKLSQDTKINSQFMQISISKIIKEFIGNRNSNKNNPIKQNFYMQSKIFSKKISNKEIGLMYKNELFIPLKYLGLILGINKKNNTVYFKQDILTKIDAKIHEYKTTRADEKRYGYLRLGKQWIASLSVNNLDTINEEQLQDFINKSKQKTYSIRNYYSNFIEYCTECNYFKLTLKTDITIKEFYIEFSLTEYKKNKTKINELIQLEAYKNTLSKIIKNTNYKVEEFNLEKINKIKNDTDSYIAKNYSKASNFIKQLLIFEKEFLNPDPNNQYTEISIANLKSNIDELDIKKIITEEHLIFLKAYRNNALHFDIPNLIKTQDIHSRLINSKKLENNNKLKTIVDNLNKALTNYIQKPQETHTKKVAKI